MKEMIKFTLNGKAVQLETNASRSLLRFLRGDQQLIGTKYGCGEGVCGAQARHVLLGLASAQLGVDAGQLKVKDGVVFSPSDTSQKVSYADLAQKHDIAQSAKANVACGIDAGTVVASMAEVEVNPETGAITVKRVVCAQDMGQVVNPAGATLQMEGCITMGLGYALTEEQRFKDGEIQGLNYYDYDIPLFSWLPKIETILIDSDDPDPHGGGEPAIINMGAVIANAVFDATGKRLFELPMTPARVKAAEVME